MKSRGGEEEILWASVRHPRGREEGARLVNVRPGRHTGSVTGGMADGGSR